MTHSSFTQLRDLFAQTGPAHHRAFIETDGYDPEWPLWYAAYLQEPLNGMLSRQWTQSELVYLLVLVEKERLKEQQMADWPTYYAHFFLAQQ